MCMEIYRIIEKFEDQIPNCFDATIMNLSDSYEPGNGAALYVHRGYGYFLHIWTPEPATAEDSPIKQ